MPQNFRRNIYEISLRRPCAFVQTLSGFAKNAALRLTATAIPRFNVRQLLFRRVNYEKNYCIVTERSFPERLVRERGCFAIVCDGMGGMRGGERASRLCAELLSGEFHMRRYESPAVFYRTLIPHADSAVAMLTDEEGNRLGGGTTLVSVIVKDGVSVSAIAAAALTAVIVLGATGMLGPKDATHTMHNTVVATSAPKNTAAAPTPTEEPVFTATPALSTPTATMYLTVSPTPNPTPSPMPKSTQTATPKPTPTPTRTPKPSSSVTTPKPTPKPSSSVTTPKPPSTGYTVRFKDGQTGEIFDTQQVQHGGSVSFPVPPDHTDEGFEFVTWSANGDTNYVTQNLLIKALYKRITGSSVGPAALCSNNRCSEVK